MSKNSLKVEGLTCGYGDREIIVGADFSVEKGDFAGIIGPNASGKTTLLKTINQVLAPKGGAVYLNGRDLEGAEERDIAQDMATVPQEFDSNYSFTTLEMVTLGRTPHLGPLESEGKQDMAVVKSAMERTDTWRLHSRDFNELSGGEKQRVIIAKALAQEPTVLLLDEPTNHLDISNQLIVLDLLDNLTEEEEKCAITTFHDLNIASKYCDFLILLHDSKIYAKGTPKEVLTEENIRDVYGAEVSIRRIPETNSLSVNPVSRSMGSKDSRKRNFGVHFICGGGTGSSMMNSLKRKNFTVSAGVLSPLDDDYKEARRLGIETVECSPFSEIPESKHQKNRKLAEKSDAVVVTEMPFGEGNLKNLELAEEISRDKPTLLIKQKPIEEKDFTGGRAKELFSSLEERATTAKNMKEVISHILELERKK